MSTWAWRLLAGALAFFGGSVAVFVKGWPAWRPDWDLYIYAFITGAAVTATGGVLLVWVVLEARDVAARFQQTADRIDQGRALDEANTARSERALDVVLGDGWEQRGLTVRQHLTGTVYGNEGRRTGAGR